MNANVRWHSLPLRSVFISDLHLGSKNCHAAELAEFLEGLVCERLYLVGDILDLWWLREKRAAWGPAQNRVIAALTQLRRQGTALIYVPGNHDSPLRQMVGLSLPRMSVHRRLVHRCADGRRLLVTHGDEFDAVTRWRLRPRRPLHRDLELAPSLSPKALHELASAHHPDLPQRLKFWLGDKLYDALLLGNRLSHRARRWCGQPYWSLAGFLKRQSRAAERFIDAYVEACLDDVRQRGLDGIVCGHIHRPALFEREGLLYVNDGDWVESLSAVVEDHQGQLHLLHWRAEGVIETGAGMRLALA